MAILRGPHSWLCITDPDAKQLTVEADCYQCKHCGKIKKVPPEVKRFKINVCKKCMGRVCDNCYGKPCRPLEAWLEQHETIGRRGG